MVNITAPNHNSAFNAYCVGNNPLTHNPLNALGPTRCVVAYCCLK